MSNNYYNSRKRWNAANYKQLNFSVNPKLSEAFQAACEQNGYSMRKVIIEFMTAYAATLPTPKKPEKGYSERRIRRKTVKSITNQLTLICAAENQYKDNMPENLKNSSRYASAEQTVEILEEAIELLNDVFI
jgi:hypothetical protein